MLTIEINVRNTSSIIDVSLSHRLVKILQIPNSEFPACVWIESGGNKCRVVDPCDFLGSWALMRGSLKDWTLDSRIKDCHSVLLYHTAEQISYWTPAHTSAALFDACESYLTLSLIDIPHSDSAIFWVWSQHVLDYRVPLDGFAFLCMIIETDSCLSYVLCESFFILNQPKLYIGIIWRRSQQPILERAPLQVSDCAWVTLNQRTVLIEALVVISTEHSDRRGSGPVYCSELSIACHSILFVVNARGYHFELAEWISNFSI